MTEKTKVYDEDGKEFEYFDENPKEDPFLICPKCEGYGICECPQHGMSQTCWFCNGSGKTK